MKNQTKHYVILGFFTLLIILIPLTKGFSEDLQPPQQVIQSVSEQLKQKLQDKVFTRNFAQVTQFVNGVIDPHTDFNKIAPLVLGKHWKTATTDEQARFKHEFQILLVRTYSRAFVEYNNWSMTLLPLETSTEPTKTIVKTKVMQPGQQPIDVNYRMLLSKGEWKVYDIMIDGVSLVTNYRATFSDEIQTKGSLNAVIDALVKRNTEALAAKDS
ncbi:phospholipid-binding protein MlaC [Methylobacter sp. S3L5C]|uniref:MlaC/ttg2D family ABC transporter substrate-binding protein n=1 Tax=Methylobacter sp. S3L5C TaxID=2839024 RepID=UPI001FAC57EB|nr:ABC transporter substrate-binding protein [Methylobacter sp. S3L5C]UOA09402.1 ABC transporter substrate-binding protein [Methylobacter sp. S3L5C]